MKNATPKHKTATRSSGCFYISKSIHHKESGGEFLGQIGQRNSNQYFVESEHGHAAAPEGQGQVASAAVRWGTPPVISFEPANATK